MRLTNRFSRTASLFARQGRVDASHGHVESLEVGESNLSARVRDSGRAAYAVRIDWSGAIRNHRVTAACECRRFHLGSVCPHIWAAVSGSSRAMGELPPEVLSPSYCVASRSLVSAQLR